VCSKLEWQISSSRHRPKFEILVWSDFFDKHRCALSIGGGDVEGFGVDRGVDRGVDCVVV
jgi:hypothetical protein